MSDEITLKEIEVQKLKLRPGDVVVFKLPKDTKHSWLHRFAGHVYKLLPRNPALLVCNDVVIEVITEAEAAKLKETSNGSKT